MNKITYFGDNQKTDFAFSFNFFKNSDIQVEINGILQTSGYTLTPIINTEPSDIPYVGGAISFNNAPKSTDIITIYRKIEMSRMVDYQPTEKIDPEILNQDFNYLIEVIKDCDAAISDFAEKYAELSKLPQITQLDTKLDNLQADLDALGNFSNIAKKSEITSLQNATSFTSTGKKNIANLAAIDGTCITLNFLGTDPGKYTYTAEVCGFLLIGINPVTDGLISVMTTPGSTTMFAKTLVANIRESILLPVAKSETLTITTGGENTIAYQRIFPLKGAK